MSSDDKRLKRIEKAFVKGTTSNDSSVQVTQSTKKSKAKTSSKTSTNNNEATENLSEIVQYQSSVQAIRTDDLKIQRLSLHEQILKRPDTYIGNTENMQDYTWILTTKDNTSEVNSDNDEENEDDEKKVNSASNKLSKLSTADSDVLITKQLITVNDGLLRLFVEVLSNAIDNVWRSIEANIQPSFIRVNISRTKCSIWNDGRNIPTKMHETENIPIPELIFGNLLTSSNYNDEEERKTSGRNGYGVKGKIFILVITLLFDCFLHLLKFLHTFYSL